ncbi:hypothetical protein RF11_14880 [Thelohanellus kitauei]|uniref:Uncharacterized protein n=1 Tax=Thelohanellus kitauei TaxID=669202 RepID=A0A0C2IV46_THEKT|nr:hypothetical protein RF11_14880 [Thelohanellus kitauei]
MAMESLGLTAMNVVNWFSFCRTVCLDWCGDNSETIGGENRVVEIDKAKIVKQKYNRGRWMDGYWIFGGFERGTGRPFAVQTAGPILIISSASGERFDPLFQGMEPGKFIQADIWQNFCLKGDSLTILTLHPFLKEISFFYARTT